MNVNVLIRAEADCHGPCSVRWRGYSVSAERQVASKNIPKDFTGRAMWRHIVLWAKCAKCAASEVSRVSTWRLLLNSFLVMTSFLIGGYNMLLKKELRRSLQA